MLFNTLPFAIFFIVVILLFWGIPMKMRTLYLLVASYAFYAFWDWRFLALIFLISFTNFHIVRLLNSKAGNARKRLLVFIVSLNLVTLAVFKYLDFFADSLSNLLGKIGFEPTFSTLNLILPLGISFFTFKAISYAVDVYKRELEPTKSIVEFATYLSYFPYMIAGPIMSAKVMLPQFKKLPNRISPSTIKSALLLITLGFFKKTVIGDYSAPLVNRIFDNNTYFDWKTLLIGIFAFSLQIYGDFSGYSDMGRGISRLMGIELARNFEEPYLSRNITEFWRRWHISLSSWFRKYLYIPLGGNRVSVQRSSLNLLIVMTIAGFWHGAAITFLIWGAVHGALLIVHKLMLLQKSRARIAKGIYLFSTAKILITFCTVSIVWVFFRAESFDTSIQIVSRIVSKDNGTFDRMDFLQLLILLAFSFGTDLVVKRYRSAKQVLGTYTSGFVIGVLLSVALSFRSSEIVPFVYFQF
jgi:D-alanyl-lipoteichoic acid acyltransferase DltB (MBOAT superfamily)